MATTADGSISQVNGLGKVPSNHPMEGGLMVNSDIEHGRKMGKQPENDQDTGNSSSAKLGSISTHQTSPVRQIPHVDSSYVPPEQPSPLSQNHHPAAIFHGFPDDPYQQQKPADDVNGIEVVEPMKRIDRTKRMATALIPPEKRWRLAVAIALVALLLVIIALATVLGVKVKKNVQPPGPTSNPPEPSSLPDPPVVRGYPQAQVLPSTNSIAATDIIVGTLFSPESDKPQLRILYKSNDKLCIKTKLGSSFTPQVRCIENSNAKDDTPLTICDWLGGPTVVYITKDNHLAGFDYVPVNDSWVPSLITTNTVPVHPSSRLSSVTWLNGTSMWIYYQGQDSQLREWGIDDYRNVAFRDGSAGPLAAIQNGSSIGVVRYGATGADETEEACFQVTNGALHCRRYANSVWGDEQYTIAGTESGLALQTSFDLTLVPDATSGNITVAVAYLKTNGYIGLQTRPAIKGADIKTLGTFSKGTQIALGDGDASAGLVINGESGTVNVYLKKTPVNGGHIFQYSSNANMVTWSNGTDITLS
ncbi:hypothetical protein BJ875DRAFT_48784 [Amylocarpus encephaloides]|uniref:Fucose-specific lectin n=1 Tax=Amylocarpus encephaloides TaxID=45428 RepID=A0A9P7YRI4_9HELO|nr:hypothetical protein BJ875DRAFT_48784 [Amylocarpus encephaloides]